MTLQDAENGREYVIKGIATKDEELNSFLFSLGCYEGESVTVIIKRKSGCVIAIKDGRYHIDRALAEAIAI
ncbi:MAG: ferrous iron transport protein A [Clostridia bacterium]|nr:ferrous iron transport protein A [Clostridia bacterium]